jgi:hypothetical protein
VVHRDLKPGNLLVGQDGGVKVADFGLAKQVGGEQSTVLTRTGTFAGTMHYMAPEQAEGMDITPATDVYALGIIWHELLTGKRPGGGRLKLQRFRSDCPADWESVMEDCLDRESSDRPNLADIKQVLEAEAFESYIDDEEEQRKQREEEQRRQKEEEQRRQKEEEQRRQKEEEQRRQNKPPVVKRIIAPSPKLPVVEKNIRAEEEKPKSKPEPVAVVGGDNDGYTAEPESKEAKSKIPLVMCGVVGLAILWALFGRGVTPIWEFETGGRVYSSPAIGSDGTVYVGSVDNKLYAINGKSGVKLWEFETENFVVSSPAIGSDGTVYVGSDDGKLYAINGKSGVKLWEFKTGSYVGSSPAIGSDGTVYVGSNDKKLYAINGKSGVKLWEFETGGFVVSSPAIGSDGTVYVGSLDKKLYAIKTESLGLAKSPWPMRGQNARHTGRTK